MAPRKKLTIQDLYEMKRKGEKISFLTCYDYPSAVAQEAAGIEMILVGDSLAMTVLGEENTLSATMDLMVVHARAVRKGAPSAFVIGDMPYMTYQPSARDAILNAGRFMAESGCDAVKLEGGVKIAATVRAMVDSGIPVMGHIGLTPQSTAMLSGFKVQGKDAESARLLIEDAKALEEAGVFSMLLECIPQKVAVEICKNVDVLTVGIGAGDAVDVHALIMHDVVGMFDKFVPKFVKKYADVSKIMVQAFSEFKGDVKEKRFPQPQHFYGISEEELKKLQK
jgi:3-methyl-2-oxobutanoate hydroxymethyltransferase